MANTDVSFAPDELSGDRLVSSDDPDVIGVAVEAFARDSGILARVHAIGHIVRQTEAVLTADVVKKPEGEDDHE